MESVLTSIKKLLGVEDEYAHFDFDIVMHINSALMAVNQLGVGPTAGINITDKTDTWGSVLGEREDLAAIKSYVYLKVRLLFDPPQTGYLIDAIKDQCKELEWRINVQAEGGSVENDE